MAYLAAEKSVVKVIADFVYPNYTRPWMRNERAAGSGSGFCISLDVAKLGGATSKNSKTSSKSSTQPAKPSTQTKSSQAKKYILTNAHCVLDAIRIFIHRAGIAQNMPAKVVYIVEECDLAILETDDAFIKDMPALTFGGMPKKLSKVYVMGYPLGGMNMSLTKGAVNRIQIVPYLGFIKGIAIQVDAPINFGNSGGPAVDADGKVVGIAFYGEDDSKTQNMGYLIPTLIVNYVLDKFTAGLQHRGLADLAIRTQTANNAAMRKRYNLKDSDPGLVIVESHIPEIKENDVLISVDGITIDSDGTILLKDLISMDTNEVVPWGTITGLRKEGDTVKVGLIRDKKAITVEAPVRVRKWGVPYFNYQSPNEYYMLGGLVFVTFSYMYFNERRAAGDSVQHLYCILYDSQGRDSDRQYVIISEALDTPLTEGYHHVNHVVQKINGKSFKSLGEFRKIATEIAETKKGYIELEVLAEGGASRIVLDVAEVVEQQDQILADNGMRK